MNKSIYFFLLLVLIFTIFNCNKNINTGGRLPSAVHLIPSSGDTSLIERGIDAVPESDGIRLEWISSSEDGIAGYEIFRGLERDGTYKKIAGVEVLTALDSVFIDEDVSLFQRYYYFIKTVDREGRRSISSDTLDYKLIRKAVNLLPKGEINNSRPDFSWEDPNQEGKYVIRVVDVESDSVISIVTIFSSYNPPREEVSFGNVMSGHDSLLVQKDYKWRVDVVGSEQNSGSESGWVIFKVK